MSLLAFYECFIPLLARVRRGRGRDHVRDHGHDHECGHESGHVLVVKLRSFHAHAHVNGHVDDRGCDYVRRGILRTLSKGRVRGITLFAS